MNLREIWCEDTEWIHLAQDRVQWKSVVNIKVDEYLV